MVSVIIGNKGSGKTKRLIEMLNEAIEKTDGNVVCIEKEPNLRYNVTYRARLTDTDRFGVSDYDCFYGFLSGIVASDHDITCVFVDATLKIGGKNYDELVRFMKRTKALSEANEVNFVFTVSADEDELPAELFTFVEKI